MTGHQRFTTTAACLLATGLATASARVQTQQDLRSEVADPSHLQLSALLAKASALDPADAQSGPLVKGSAEPGERVVNPAPQGEEAPGSLSAEERRVKREQVLEEMRALINSPDFLEQSGASQPGDTRQAAPLEGGAIDATTPLENPEDSDAVILVSEEDLGAVGGGEVKNLEPGDSADLLATPVRMSSPAGPMRSELFGAGNWFSRQKLTISFDADVVYDDNIFFSERDEVDDLIYVLRPSIEYAIGDYDRREGSYAAIYYSPEAIWFQDNSSEDNLDHHARIEYGGRFQRLAYSLLGEYDKLSGATPDIGGRAERDVYGVEVGLTYDLSARTGFRNTLAWNSEDYVDNIDYEEWSNELFVEYDLTPKTRLGLGGSFGQLRVEGAGKQDFQQALFTVDTELTGKIDFNFQGGVEFRQFAEGGSETTPVFGAKLQYRPRPGTVIDLAGERVTESSTFLAGQNIQATRVSLGFTQRLGHRFSLQLRSGYERADYRGVGRGIQATRTDDYFFVRPSIRYVFRDDYRLELFYYYRDNDSTVASSEFTGNQFGVSLGHDF